MLNNIKLKPSFSEIHGSVEVLAWAVFQPPVLMKPSLVFRNKYKIPGDNNSC